MCYITILNMFRTVPCSSSGGQIVLLQPLVSSLSVKSRTVCRWTADCSPLSTCILYGCLQTVTIPEAVIIQFVLLKMSKVLFLMDAIPLCDVIKAYTNIYVNTQQYFLTQFYYYLERGDMFRLHIQQSSGQLTIE